jgi:hypothetical protein
MINILPFYPSDFFQFISWIDSHETLVQFAGATTFQFPVTEVQLQSN